MLQEDVPKNFDDVVGHITMVILAAHITTLAREVITVTNFVFLGPTIVFIISSRGWVGAIGIEAFAILVNWDKFLRL